MATTRAGFSNLLAPGLRKVFYDEYKMVEEQYPAIFNILTSTMQNETDSKISGLGSMPQKTEGQGITYDDPLKGNNTVYTHLTYGLGFRVTEEMWEDDLYNKIKKMPAALSRSARARIETTAADVFNNGFTDSAAYLGADSEPLFGDGTTYTHPLLNGDTVYNQLPTPADLSPTSLKDALTYWRAMTDDRGLIITIPPRYLVVPPELEFTAEEILGSTQEPYTAENQINVLRKRLTLVVWDYLTDADAWFILSDKSNHALNFFWRRKLTQKNSDDFDSGDAKFKATMRYSVWYSDFRGVLGVPGA